VRDVVGPPVTSTAPAVADQARGVAGPREFIAMVTTIMASGAIAIDLMLPAFPEMRTDFGLAPDSSRVAWVITAFFLGMAIGPWLFGPASDRYGRRGPLAAGLVLYVIGAVMAVLAPSFGMVVAARFIWGLGAGAPRALSTAIIRDRYEGNAMARLMSMIMAVFMLVPILAPALGAGLMAFLPWRSVFALPAVIGIAMLLWMRRLPETLPPERRRPFTWSSVGRAGREVLTHRQTMSLTLAMMFLFSVLAAYLGSAELILEDVYHYGDWFPLFFGFISVMLAMSSLNNARLVERVGVERLISRMAIASLIASAALLAISLTSDGLPNFWLFTIVLACMMPMTHGLVPNCNTVAMMPLPHVAGTATSIMSTITTAGGALLGGLASGAFDGTVRPFSGWVFVFVALAALLIRFGSTRRPAAS
jgi:DHA1 family bicyclomycin/chloramphenicol resistance-like MFS transporter